MSKQSFKNFIHFSVNFKVTFYCITYERNNDCKQSYFSCKNVNLLKSMMTKMQLYQLL